MTEKYVWRHEPSFLSTSICKNMVFTLNEYHNRTKNNPFFVLSFSFIVGQVSISPTFYEQLFRAKDFRVTFLYLHCRFKLFWRKEIGEKAARKMLVKLTLAGLPPSRTLPFVCWPVSWRRHVVVGDLFPSPLISRLVGQAHENENDNANVVMFICSYFCYNCCLEIFVWGKQYSLLGIQISLSNNNNKKLLLVSGCHIFWRSKKPTFSFSIIPKIETAT